METWKFVVSQLDAGTLLSYTRTFNLPVMASRGRLREGGGGVHFQASGVIQG